MRSVEEVMTVEMIPVEILSYIFSMIEDVVTKCRLEIVSTTFRLAALSPEVWMKVSAKHEFALIDLRSGGSFQKGGLREKCESNG